ncbi:MAG: hypothetical protein Q4F57_09560 [Weeksellaceae bacterium]|nr:hypothetical protein [Weeksellaceae bacterium]
MSVETIKQFLKEKALEFGAKNDSYGLRDNTKSSFETNTHGAYLGFVEFEEGNSGVYHDFSLVIFPSDMEAKSIIICLAVGTQGFKNDYNLATYPGLRRMFKSLSNDEAYCKTDFSDLETSLPKKFIDNIESDYLKKSISKYAKVLPACSIITEPESEEGKQIIAAYVASYAKLRD